MNQENDPRTLAERVAQLERQVAALEVQLANNDRPGTAAQTAPASAPAVPPPLPRRSPPPPLASPPVARPPQADREPTPAPGPARNWDEPSYPDFRPILRKLNLWPPEGEGNFEVQLGAWWATRIGALLAVIGVVFFGIYVAHGTPPWARLLQLAAVAIGVTVAGHWLERREAKFGAVVFGSGLALIFFSAFAAYAVPAVKIVAHPLVAVALQGMAVAAIAGASFWKNRSNLATMAILFGFVTCFFSLLEQLRDISLVAAFLLAATAAVLWLAKGWLPPLACSVPAAYLIYGAIVLFGWADGNAPPFVVAMAFPAAAFVLFSATDFAGNLRGLILPPRERRLLQAANAAGATGLGLLAATRYFGDSLVIFYGLFAALFLLAAIAQYRRDREDELAHIWFAAAMGLLGLGFIEALDARTRWMALAVQSAAVLYTARRTRLWTAEAVMGALWLGSAGLFLHDTYQAGLFETRAGFGTLWGAVATGYVALSAILLSLQARWLADRPITLGATGQESASPAETRRGRLQLNALYAAILGTTACAAVFAGSPAAWLPAGAVVVALLLAVLALAARHWLPAAAAVLPFAFGQWSFWTSPVPGDWSVWINGAASIGSALALAVAAHLAVARQRLPADLSRAALAGAHGIWLISVQVLLFKTTSVEMSFLVAALLGLVLLLKAGGRRINYLADLAPVPIAFALVTAGLARSEILPPVPSSGNSPVLWAAAILLLGVVTGRDCWSKVAGLKNLFPTEMYARVLGGFAATALVLVAVGNEFSYPFLPAAMGLAGIFVVLLGRWPGWSVAPYSGLLLFVAGHIGLWISFGLERGDELWWALLLAGTTLTYALATRNRSLLPHAAAGPPLQWVAGSLAAGSLFLLFLTRTGPLEPYTTVFWGLSAIAIFAAGLVWRVKPLRIIGLAGLGLCLPRIFLVDIHSTFYRIAAFVVVGAVLLVVGFLYHKFRHRIAEMVAGPGEET